MVSLILILKLTVRLFDSTAVVHQVELAAHLLKVRVLAAWGLGLTISCLSFPFTLPLPACQHRPIQ